MQFLSKLKTKAVFTAAPELNITAYDMGEEMISATIEDEVVNRLPTATGTIGSLAIFVPVTVSISILKTSNVISDYLNRILENGYIGGTLTIYSDVNTPYSITDVSLGLKDIGQLNGTQPALTFEVKGNLEVNKVALQV